jgi:hypothetical protein
MLQACCRCPQPRGEHTRTVGTLCRWGWPTAVTGSYLVQGLQTCQADTAAHSSHTKYVTTVCSLWIASASNIRHTGVQRLQAQPGASEANNKQPH